MKFFGQFTIAGLLAFIAFGALAQSAPLLLQPRCPAASAPAAKPAAPAGVDRATAIAGANDWLNGAALMTADFVQIGGDGSRTEGKLYVQKPGRMHFSYAAPAALEIRADGTSVAVIDRKLKTQDLSFIGQTPLKFLLKDHIDLARDTKVLDVGSEGKSTSIFIEDKATFGGTSRIKLTFDSTTFALKQWKVVDPQGYETLVTLFNINTTSTPDAALFKIDQDRYPRR